MSFQNSGAAFEKRSRGWTMVGALLGLLAVPAFIELVLAVSPGTAAYATYGVFCGTLILLWKGPRRASMVVAIGALLGLSVLRVVPWTSRKEFLRHFNEIKIGMTMEEVGFRMHGYEFGERPLPSGPIMRTYIHSRSGRFDSDWGVITFAGGRVVELKFLPD